VIQPDYSNDVDGAARMSKLGHLVTSRDIYFSSATPVGTGSWHTSRIRFPKLTD
jgi:hypothetical protein